MELLPFLQSKKLFTEEEAAVINDAFKKEMIPKDTVIQQLHGYSEKVLFIELGLLRTFYLKDGKDITHFFFDENFLVAPINSIYFNKSEPYGWQSIEECSVRTIQFHEFMALKEQIPALTELILEFAIKMLHLYSQKLDLLQFQTAFERYNLFLKMYPNLHNRVSLGSTASFLGVTQQTLSVIRAKKE